MQGVSSQFQWTTLQKWSSPRDFRWQHGCITAPQVCRTLRSSLSEAIRSCTSAADLMQ
jgi:hypothetical protein